MTECITTSGPWHPFSSSSWAAQPCPPLQEGQLGKAKGTLLDRRGLPVSSIREGVSLVLLGGLAVQVRPGPLGGEALLPSVRPKTRYWPSLGRLLCLLCSAFPGDCGGTAAPYLWIWGLEAGSDQAQVLLRSRAVYVLSIVVIFASDM